MLLLCKGLRDALRMHYILAFDTISDARTEGESSITFKCRCPRPCFFGCVFMLLLCVCVCVVAVAQW